MGYTSNVKILMGKKAFELLKERCSASEDEDIRNMVIQRENNVEIDTSETNGAYPENSVSILCGAFKWYSNYEEIKAVENTLLELNEMVEEDPEKLKDYFYKKIQVGEDGATYESTNDENDEYVSDFYTNVDFNI